MGVGGGGLVALLDSLLLLITSMLKSLVTVNSNDNGYIFINYRSGMFNSNTVNSKFHLIRSFCEIFEIRFLSFHV